MFVPVIWHRLIHAWRSKYNKSVYQVVKDHNDNGKEVYLSEIGWTDNGTTNEEIKVEIANNYKIAYNLIKNELPWITAIFAFRLTNLKTQVESIAEKNFGIFYHPDDEVHKGSPKPAAIEIAKLYNGENYDLLEHLQWAKRIDIFFFFLKYLDNLIQEPIKGSKMSISLILRKHSIATQCVFG